MSAERDHDERTYICQECGMSVAKNEYHPYLACLAYRSGQPGRIVREYLDDVVATAKRHEKEACATRVEALMGREAGNWNRAIVYAVAAIRHTKEPS